MLFLKKQNYYINNQSLSLKTFSILNLNFFLRTSNFNKTSKFFYSHTLKKKIIKLNFEEIVSPDNLKSAWFQLKSNPGMLIKGTSKEVKCFRNVRSLIVPM